MSVVLHARVDGRHGGGGIEVGFTWRRASCGNLREDGIDITGGAEVVTEVAKNARPLRRKRSRRGRWTRSLVRGLGWPLCAKSGVLGQRGGADGDVDARVKEILRLASVARGPRDGHAEKADRWTAAVLENVLNRGLRVGDRGEAIVGGERDEIAHEQRVIVRNLSHKSQDELVVKMQAAGEDDGQ